LAVPRGAWRRQQRAAVFGGIRRYSAVFGGIGGIVSIGDMGDMSDIGDIAGTDDFRPRPAAFSSTRCHPAPSSAIQRR
jgi:hypothetical protein